MSQSFVVRGLYAAARSGKQKQVDELLAKGVDVNQPDKDGCTCVMWASWGGHSGVLRKLLTAGADANLVNLSEANALHW
jgi:ankyrin repeat protein